MLHPLGGQLCIEVYQTQTVLPQNSRLQLASANRNNGHMAAEQLLYFALLPQLPPVAALGQSCVRKTAWNRARLATQGAWFKIITFIPLRGKFLYSLIYINLRTLMQKCHMAKS